MCEVVMPWAREPVLSINLPIRTRHQTIPGNRNYKLKISDRTGNPTHNRLNQNVLQLTISDASTTRPSHPSGWNGKRFAICLKLEITNIGSSQLLLFTLYIMIDNLTSNWCSTPRIGNTRLPNLWLAACFVNKSPTSKYRVHFWVILRCVAKTHDLYCFFQLKLWP